MRFKYIRISYLFWCALAAASYMSLGAWADGGNPGLNGETLDQITLFLGRFHPIVLHFPVGILVALFAVEMVAMFRSSRSWEGALWLLLIVGALSAVTAAAFGVFLSWEGGYDAQTVFWHKWTGIGVAGLAVLAVILKAYHERVYTATAATAYRVCLLVCVGLLTVAGHFGGNLTHGSTYLFENMPDWMPLATYLQEGSGDSGEVVSGSVYAETILPLFESSCYECHGDTKQKGDFVMTSRDALLAGGESGLPAVVPGDAMASNLVRVITLPEEHKAVMPPKGKGALSGDTVTAIIHWIDRGADYGDGSNLIEIETATNAPAEIDLSGLSEDEPLDFVTYILPIFQASCWECHDEEEQEGELRMDTLAHFLKGGEFGAIVEPGNLDDSTLFELITLPADDTDFMPAKNDPLPDEQIALIKRWILEGCDFGDWTGEE